MVVADRLDQVTPSGPRRPANGPSAAGWAAANASSSAGAGGCSPIATRQSIFLAATRTRLTLGSGWTSRQAPTRAVGHELRVRGSASANCPSWNARSPRSSSASSPHELQKSWSTTRRRIARSRRLGPGDTSVRPGRQPGAVEGAGLGRQGRDPPLALAPGVDREPRVRLLVRVGPRLRLERDLDDLVAELLDHPLVDLDRLGVIARLGMIVVLRRSASALWLVSK